MTSETVLRKEQFTFKHSKLGLNRLVMVRIKPFVIAPRGTVKKEAA